MNERVRRIREGEFKELEKTGKMDRICLMEMIPTEAEQVKYIGCPDKEAEIIRDRIIQRYHKLVEDIGHVDAMILQFTKKDYLPILKVATCKKGSQFIVVVEEKLYRKISPELRKELNLL